MRCSPTVSLPRRSLGYSNLRISLTLLSILLVSDAEDYPKDVKHPPTSPPPQHQPQPTAMPAIHGTPLIDVPGTSGAGVRVYHYVHPVTQQRITSLLPPDHPEMVCLQQGHERRSSFGLVGILAAIFWFPLGMACMLVDRKVRCTRSVPSFTTFGKRIIEHAITIIGVEPSSNLACVIKSAAVTLRSGFLVLFEAVYPSSPLHYFCL
jgi:hypothetical protein